MDFSYYERAWFGTTGSRESLFIFQSSQMKPKDLMIGSEALRKKGS